jgi:hypothetical protein
MKNVLIFSSKEAGDSASIKILGGADIVHICLFRGSSQTKDYTIYLNPSWLQELRDQFNNIGLGINKTPREYYNAKIRDVVKRFAVIADKYVEEDKLQISKILELRKTEEQNREDFKIYVDTLITDMETKK